MVIRERLEAQLPHALAKTSFERLGPRYQGKVRDVYDLGDRLLIITTDRVSAFDRVLGTVPFKGEILNQLALDAFAKTADVVKNHVLESPDPAAVLVKKCRALPVEFVVRGYVTGSLWRDLGTGAAAAYGLDLPAGLQKDGRLDRPILTPSTKAKDGEHDEPTSKAKILASGAMDESTFEQAEAAAFALFERGQALASARGLLLVDTKYEFGIDADGELIAIDELHTPDSSRYWVTDEYEARFAEKKPQRMLDKENLRAWLLDRGFSGHGEAPALDDGIRVELAERYLELFSRLTGHTFDAAVGPAEARLRAHLEAIGLAP